MHHGSYACRYFYKSDPRKAPEICISLHSIAYVCQSLKHSTVVCELVFPLLKHLAKPFPPLIESSLLPFERQRYGTFPAQRKFSFIPLKRTSEHVWLCLARQGLQCKHTPGIVYYRFILTSCTITLSAVEVQTTLTTRNELLLLAYVLWIDILSSLGFGIHSYI